MQTNSSVLAVSLALLGACKSAPEAPPETLPAAPSSQPAASSDVPPSTTSTAKAQVYGEATTQIDAHVGERFEIALPANVTTPFKWTLAPESLSDVATLSDQTYTDSPPAGCDPCVGYPGTAHFMLDAAQEGETTLKLSYRGLGEKGEVKRELSIGLRVTP